MRAPMSKETHSNLIARNKRARFEYHLEDSFEAGLVLEGWEVKALREGKGQITEAYVIVKNGEAFLLGARIAPLPTASTHVNADPTRTRKLLLHGHELNKLIGATERRGYTIVPLRMYWKKGRAKLEIALAKGKLNADKRKDKKDKDWARDKERIMKNTVR